MKKVLKSLALIAAAAMTLASCQNELQPEVTPGTVVSKGTVHVEFGATSNEPQTKVTLGTSDDIKFEADWISGTDKLWIDYAWETEDDCGGTAVLSNEWNGNSFEADLVGPKGIENQDLPAHWVYTCYYPQPRIESNNHYFAFDANRDQDGSNYAGQYDLMYGGAETTNSVAGKDGDNKVVFKMDRLTSIAYFHITTSGFDASEKLASATLEITEADDKIIACDEVYYKSGTIYKNGANQSSSITLNTTQAMDDIKLWYNVIPLTFRKATLTLTTDKGKYITLNMGDGVKEFAYMPGELQKAKIGPIPVSVFTAPEPPAPATFTDVITYADLAATSSGYTPFEGVKKSADNDITSDAVYAGSSSLNGTAVMQFKSKDNNTGIISTTSGGLVSSISVSFNSQNRNTFNVYGSNEAYTSVSKLYNDDTAGTLVGTLNSSSTTLEFSDDYEYFGIRSNDGAVYVDNITIVWSEDSTPKYEITVDASVDGGSILASSALAKEGAEITLLATPFSARYEFGSWNVTNASTGDPITVIDNKFTMPAAAVNVSATFNKLPYKVTYNKNTDDISFAGTVPTDAKNYTDADNQVTVADGSGLTRDDYTFASWNTKANGEGISYESGAKFNISDDVTLYAQWTRNTYEVTIETPVNGTLVIKNGETVVNSGDKLQSGVTLTVVPTPATGYRFDKWGYKDGDKAWVNNMTSTFTHVMPMAPVQFKVTFEEIPTHLVKFSVNGTIVNGDGEGETLNEGAEITFPDDPVAIGDMKFQGWVTSAIDGTTDTKPSFVSKNGQTVGTEDVTYYAVFANVVEGTTSYKLVSSLTNGKNYIFVTRNTAGPGYALSSNVTTGTSVTIAESGADKVVSGTPAKTIIWTAATGWSLTNTGVDSNNKLAINGSTFAINGTGSANLSWTTKYGLNGQSGSGSTKYYVQCTNTGTFSKSSTSGSTTNRVYAYEEDSTGGTSGYCTTVEIPAQVVSIAISGNVTKTTYNAGEQLSVAGLTVTGTLDNDTQRDLTNDPGLSWTFDPATLSVGTTSCTATAHYQTLTDSYEATGLTVNAAVTLESVTVSGAPTRKEYKAGEAFDPDGLTVIGTYSDSHQETITEGITWSEPEALTEGQTRVTITATVNGITSAPYTVTGLTVNASGFKGTIASWTSTSANTISSNAWSSKGSSDMCGTNASITLKNSSATVQTITPQTVGSGANAWYLVYGYIAGNSYWDISMTTSQNLASGTKIKVVAYIAVNSKGITSWTAQFNAGGSSSDVKMGDDISGVVTNGSPSKLTDMTKVERVYTLTSDVASGTTIHVKLVAGTGTAKNGRLSDVTITAE